jgi:hypothetical protein
VAVHVGGDNLVLGVGEYAWGMLVWAEIWGMGGGHTLHGGLGGLLDDGLDLLVVGALLDADGKIDNGDVGSWDTHGHAGKLAVQDGDNLSDGLSGTGGGWDDVLGRSAASTPVLGGWAVNGLLGGGVGVDGGHEALNDSEVVVDDLGERCQAVGGARGVGDDVEVGLVGLLVDTHDEHGGIGGWGRDDNLLGATLQVSGGLLGGGENTGGLDDVVGTSLGPWDGGWVPLGVETDGLAVDDQVLTIDLDVTLELAVGGIILEHVCLEAAGLVRYSCLLCLWIAWCLTA